jgi:hypothetical protein
MDLTLFILFIGLIISIYYFIGVMNDLKKEIRNLNTCVNNNNDSNQMNQINQSKINDSLIHTLKSGLEFLKNFI